MTVFVECRDCDDLPIDEPDVHHEHVRSPVVGPSFDGNGGADCGGLTVRGVSCGCGGCTHLDAVLHHCRGAAKRPHRRHGRAVRNDPVATTHGVCPRVMRTNETKDGEEASV